MKKIILLFSVFFSLFFVILIFAQQNYADKKWFDETKYVFLGGSFTCATEESAKWLYNLSLTRDIKISYNAGGCCQAHNEVRAVKIIKYIDDGKIAEINYADPYFYDKSEQAIIHEGWIFTEFLHDREEIAKQMINRN